MRIAIAITLAVGTCIGCSHGAPTKSPGTGGGGGTPTMPGEPSDGGVPDGYFAPSQLQVSGQILDFESGKPISGAATMSTAQLSPPPAVSMSGADFTIAAVPPFSTFYVIAGSPPNYAMTYNAPTVLTDKPLDNVAEHSVAEAYLAQLRSGFGINAQSGTATVLVHVIDGNGRALAGLAGAALVPSGAGLKGPYFLDASLQPAPMAKTTSASGWLVYFDVVPGTLTFGAGSGYLVIAADTPTAADAVSLVEATVMTAPVPPPNMPPPPAPTISFQQSVLPIFINRGCYNCHSGNGPGRRLGGLVLDGGSMKIWTALVQDLSPNFNTTRVDLQDPPKSLVLIMPSYANPPDGHPVVVFTSVNDPDYQTILDWIEQGAQFN
jgi:hypothetical protein